MNTLTFTVSEPAQLQVAPLIEQLRAMVTIWVQRARQRRQLAALSASQLDDIGISREQADAEAAKPFWRA